jgi:cell division septal protein FtsQ
LDGKTGVSKQVGTGKRRKYKYLSFRYIFAEISAIALLFCAFYPNWESQFNKISLALGLCFKNLEINIITPPSKDIGTEPNAVCDTVNTHKNSITAALGLRKGISIFSVDLEKKRHLLRKNLAWIKATTIKRCLPDTIKIDVVERVPLARWQHNYKCYLIDEDGVILSDKDEDCSVRPDLPLVVGEGASTEAKILFAALNCCPDLSKRISSYVRVGRRRWDIYIDKIKVMMPEEKLQIALAKLDDLHRNLSILDHEISVIDMRIAGRYVVRGKQAKALLEKTRAFGKEI